MKRILFFIPFLLWACSSNKEPLYKDPSASIDERVEDLLGRMTLEEKFWQLFMIPGDLSDGKEKYKHGIFGLQVATVGESSNEAEQMLNYSEGETTRATAERINEIQLYFVEKTRLGIPIIAFDEALHGLIRKDAVSFPQAIGLAATWSPDLMQKVAHSMASEMKSRGIRQNLSPVINIARDVRWGRTEETYGEDSYLTSQMAVAYISAFENMGIITTPKHFVANVGDGGRDSYPIHANELLLEEVYFPAFKASIQEAGARSIMTSYNSLNGRPCTANEWLLRKKLKEEWGFKGFVISDAGAVGGANVLHYTSKDYTEATQQAISSGLDVIFQTSYDHYPLFFEAFKKGLIEEEVIDEAVRRVLRAKFELGLFENPYVELPKGIPSKKNDLKLAMRAAEESFVLLKNEGQILPLSTQIKSIGIIGPEANEARLGGYSGPGINPITILQGVQDFVGEKTKITYAEGCKRTTNPYQAIPASQLFHDSKKGRKKGLRAQYFSNLNGHGQPALERIDPNIDFRWTLFSPAPELLGADHYSVKWEGLLKSEESGEFEIGIEGEDGYRLYIDDQLLIDARKKTGHHRKVQKFRFAKGQFYRLRIEYSEPRGNVWFRLIWNQGVQDVDAIEESINQVKDCDALVVCVGIEEGEFNDRALLDLPGLQEELILAACQTGKPVIVLTVGGSAITMEKWQSKVQAILHLWYPGEQGGLAVARTLFGQNNPSGRLPITFPKHEGQLPLYYNHKPTGRGDDYVHLSGKPNFPFGYGLSYTHFSYGQLKISKKTFRKNQTTKISCQVTNSGKKAGSEVVQLYIRDELASVAQPVIQLRGFQKVHLQPGESKTVHLELGPEQLSLINENLEKVVEPGTFRIMVGSSSIDIRLMDRITVLK